MVATLFLKWVIVSITHLRISVVEEKHIHQLDFKSYIMKKIIVLLLVSAVLFSSCKTSGYGCKGKASWNDVVRKANRLY